MAATIAAEPPENRPTARWDWVLIAILLVSFGLRASLIRNGGPAFWGDESRYDVAVAAAHHLQEGKYGEGAADILSKADHMGFKAAMIPLAWAQITWRWSNGFVALLASGLFSVLNIAWVYALARRLGAARDEARWSAVLMAAAASMFYWSRHLVPYDLALCWGLACLYTGVNPAARWYHSLLAGVLGFLAFVTYNGAWMFVAVALIAHVLCAWPSWKGLIVRGVLGLVGLVGSVTLLVWAAAAVNLDLIEAYVAFAATITQGEFADGLRVMGSYLWETDHGLVLIWLGAGIVFAVTAFRRKEKLPGRIWLWVLGAVAMMAGLVVLSNVLEQFVVYGRLVRQIVPWLSLLGGWWLARLGRDVPWRRVALGATVFLFSVINLYRPLVQVFPLTFHQRGDAIITQRVRGQPDAAVAGRMRERFEYLYAGFIWPEPELYHLPPYEVALQAAHPLQYGPYLYEGFNRQQRQAFHATDITMRLIFIKD